MADASGDRTKYFPAIERQHGGPISLWIERVKDLGDVKYPEQIAYLRENHGFSQTHANALVMFVRGSTTSRRVATPADYFATLQPVAANTAKKIFATITRAHPELELVIAWNHPMLRTPEGKYVIGLSGAKQHLLINPFSGDLIERFADELRDYRTNKKTFAVPLDWKVDAPLLRALTDARLAELT